MDVFLASGSTVALLTLVVWFARNLIVTRLTQSVANEYRKANSKFVAELGWESKVRERAHKAAEYLSLARNLDEKISGTDDFHRANTLAWEMAMWLPEDVYKSMGKALTEPDNDTNVLSTVIDVRKILLGKEAGNLTPDEVLHHGLGIGKKDG